ncbi:DUF1289 domain-containing protein [Dongia sp.]|uniref:DUF1289 domain-containing protein n=1 Tax=Dongia sp. TaxID=1977262 RepID=UPI003751AA46
MNIEVRPIGSPCTGICKVDDVSGYCLGCARSSAEISEWSKAGDDRKRAIWAALPPRIDQLGIAVTRLPWLPDEVAGLIADTLLRRSGTWVAGCHGASAEFTFGAGEPAEVSVEPELRAVTARGALRFTPRPDLRALQWRDPDAAGGVRAIFIVIPRPRILSAPSLLLTACGPDTAAIQPAHRGENLFDLGLGRDHMRFLLRSASPALDAALNAAVGLPLDAVLQRCGKLLLESNPTRVVESPLGRIEVATPIPPPGGKSPDGPHTHLLPGHLALQRATPTDVDLPEAYALCATFYPRNPPEYEACRP